jgi:hypothetical protein
VSARVLLALLGDDRYTVRSGKTLRLRVSSSEAASAKIELRRGARTLARVNRALKAGTSALTITASAIRAPSSRLRRAAAGLATGNYTLVLTASTRDGRTATDSARLRVRR